MEAWRPIAVEAAKALERGWAVYILILGQERAIQVSSVEATASGILKLSDGYRNWLIQPSAVIGCTMVAPEQPDDRYDDEEDD